MPTWSSRLSQRGIAEARLTSTGTAHRFYRGAGWQDSGPEDHERGMACYPMSKRLQVRG